MKKTALSFGIALLLVPTLAGCGVPQADYDKAISDLEAAQARISDLENELAASQAEYDSLNQTVEEWTAKRDQAFLYEQIVVELIAPAVGDAEFSPETISKIEGLVDQTGDDTLKQKFDAWKGSTTDKELLADLMEYAIQKFEELLS